MCIIHVDCILSLFGIFHLILLHHSPLCRREGKSKSAQKKPKSMSSQYIEAPFHGSTVLNRICRA